jgi:hypothetical protein
MPKPDTHYNLLWTLSSLDAGVYGIRGTMLSSMETSLSSDDVLSNSKTSSLSTFIGLSLVFERECNPGLIHYEHLYL